MSLEYWIGTIHDYVLVARNGVLRVYKCLLVSDFQKNDVEYLFFILFYRTHRQGTSEESYYSENNNNLV